MIPSAPPDFWEIVARRVAQAIIDRETTLGVRIEPHAPYGQTSGISQLHNPGQQAALAAKAQHKDGAV